MARFFGLNGDLGTTKPRYRQISETFLSYTEPRQSGGDRTLDLLNHNQALLPTELLKELSRRSTIPQSPAPEAGMLPITPRDNMGSETGI